MGKLSVFVDESGDFGAYSSHCPYYIVTMVFHDQNSDINPMIQKLDEEIQSLGYGKGFAIHTAPLIRKEEMFASVLPNERRALFSKLFYFVMKSDIKYKTFVFEKSQFENAFKLQGRMAKELSSYDARKVLPKDYKLFQAADLICTLKLLGLKCERKELSNSELLLFHGERDLKRQFLKPIKKKSFD